MTTNKPKPLATQVREIFKQHGADILVIYNDKLSRGSRKLKVMTAYGSPFNTDDVEAALLAHFSEKKAKNVGDLFLAPGSANSRAVWVGLHQSVLYFQAVN